MPREHDHGRGGTSLPPVFGCCRQQDRALHVRRARYRTMRCIQAPQHFLYFFPEPQGQGSFLPILATASGLDSTSNSPLQ